MIETTLSSTQLLSYAVDHYLRYNFSPLQMNLEGEKKYQYIWENGLHLSLGKNVDHTEFCIWLSTNGPYYGVLVKDYATLNGLKQYYRPQLGAHTHVPKTVQLVISKLPINTNVLVLMNSTQFKPAKIKAIIKSWSVQKPILFIG